MAAPAQCREGASRAWDPPAREPRPRRRSLEAQRTGPDERPATSPGGSAMTRSMVRVGGGLAAALVLAATVAAPVLACGGLIGPNGAVNLLRTTTFAGYHDGEEHYVTAFQFAGGGGAFGSLTPLPGIPSKVEKGGDWTLQRLLRETEPVFLREAAASPAASARGRCRGPHGGPDRRARHHRPARRRRRGRHVGHRARLPPPARCARGPRLLRRAQPDLPRRGVRCRRGRRARPGGRRRDAGPHHHPDRQPVGPAADPRRSARPARSGSMPTSSC